MKVVVLGSQGMLGSALVKEFTASGEEVVGLDRQDLDVADTTMLERVLVAAKPEAIINTVAFNSVDEAERNDETFALAKKINGTTVGALATIAQQLDAPLVHFSTEYVFDGSVAEGYAETSLPSPVNRYGETKAL